MQSLLTMSRNILYNTLLPRHPTKEKILPRNFLNSIKGRNLLDYLTIRLRYSNYYYYFFWMTYLKLTEVAFFTFYCQGLKYHFKKVLLKISV